MQDILYQSLARVSGPKWAQFESTLDLPWSESSRQSQSASVFLNEKEKWLSLISTLLVKKPQVQYMPIQFTVLPNFKHTDLCSQCLFDISAKYIHSSYSRLHFQNLILSKQQPGNGISPPGLAQHHSTFWWNEFVSHIFQNVIIIAHALWDYLLQFNSLSLRSPQAAIYDRVLLFKVNQFPCAFLQHTVELFMCSFFTGCFSRFLLWDFVWYFFSLYSHYLWNFCVIFLYMSTT